MKNYYEKWWAKVEPTIDEFVPVVIGSKIENPVIISSNSWMEVDVDNYLGVADAEGGNKGGTWTIQVVKEGKYKLELSRWPFHLNRKLTDLGPQTTIGGFPMSQGIALPINNGCVSLNHKTPIVSHANTSYKAIEIEMYLPKGLNNIQAWFQDKNGKNICGAYYIRFYKL
jgi:hypothetical protein